MIRWYVFIFSILMILFSCKSMEQSFDEYTGKVITIGFGGGFTGGYKEYSILENGDMFKFNTLTKKRNYLGKVERNVAEQIFKNSELLNLPKRKVNLPGNSNRYIIYRINKTENKILWSDNNKVDSDLNTFYQVLLNNVKKL